MTDIFISEPNFWWRADAAQIRKFVPVDPDVDDGRQRWDDRDEQRWNLIARAVTQVSQALATGGWEQEEDQGSHGLVRIDAGGLTDTEKKIVRKWFSADESVRMDPWFEPLQNGRHRLWSTLDFFGSEPVPIKGDALGYANPADTEVLGQNWQQLFVMNVQDLAAVDWFDTTDPVNIRFANALRTAAGGHFPASC
ncbi:hypothetical protein [uncultured Arthrobacter sp.]|uniref:hypothetical protein n=1 Tax=uncultured Arthrobacter sp. TaxID=114050 RepID=UPI0028D4EE4B|nr:hypothetical protein [uncultured Arthrobacter sp.]